MPYTVTPTNLPEVLILQPQVFGDARGFFFESFNARDFAQVTGLDVQFDNARQPQPIGARRFAWLALSN